MVNIFIYIILENERESYLEIILTKEPLHINQYMGNLKFNDKQSNEILSSKESLEEMDPYQSQKEIVN